MKDLPDMKFHIKTLKTIKEIEIVHKGLLQKTNSALDCIAAEFFPEGNSYSVSFQLDVFSPNRMRIDVGQNYKKLGFKAGAQEFIFEEMFINSFSVPHISGSVNQFYTKGFSKRRKYYYRFIVPSAKELKFHYYIEHTSFSTDLGVRSSLCTEVEFEDKKIELYSIKHNKNHYTVIDINSKVLYEAFSHMVFSFLVSYGYVTGYMPGNKGYYVAYSKPEMKIPDHFYFGSLRDTVDSRYHPLHSNAFGYLREKQKLAQKIQDKLRPINLQEFSKLFELTHNSLDFSSALLLIVESSVASLLFMPGGLAIALESLSDLIVKDKKLDLAPITDKGLRKKVIKECQEIIDKNCASILNKDSLGLLKSRITSNLNKPTNKAQLRAPFIELGIELLPEDLVLLDTRNDFLHGRPPDITNAGPSRPLQRLNADIYYCSLRFYTLLNILILKWIGYDNYVVNYPKLQEKYTKVRLPKEKPFRKA